MIDIIVLSVEPNLPLNIYFIHRVFTFQFFSWFSEVEMQMEKEDEEVQR